jgi:hypothetical protein
MIVPMSIGLALFILGLWRSRRAHTSEIAGHDLVRVLKVRR